MTNLKRGSAPPLNTSLRLESDPDTLRKQVAELFTTSDVADLLEVTQDRLVWHIWKRPPGARYHHFKVKKRRGGFREIAAPKPGLKLLQRKMKQVLDAMYEPRKSVHGFVRDRSIVTNAKRHVGCEHVINIDIEDFFPSITFPRVRGMLLKWPCRLPPEAATAVAQVCFAGHEGLPQGAPTSPVIANMMCLHMDKHFAALARKHGYMYTRYSDDITLSTTRRRPVPPALINAAQGETTIGPAVREILDRHWFKVNPAKVKVRCRHERQEVTGLVTNERVNVPRRFVRQLRAILHDCDKNGFEVAQARFRGEYDTKHRRPGLQPTLIDVLIGRLSFLAMVRGRDDALVHKLIRRARALHPAFKRALLTEDAVLVLERSDEAFMRDGDASQGSGFLVADVGLVTASHVMCDEKGKVLSDMHAMRWDLLDERMMMSLLLNDPTHDFAVLDIDAPHLPRYKAGNSDAVRVGDTLVLRGFPHWAPGNPPSVTTVEVTGLAPKLDSPRIFVSVPVHKGNSGGVALNAKGEAVGIVVTGDGTRKARHPNGLVPIRTVLAELRAHHEREDAERARIAALAATVVTATPAKPRATRRGKKHKS